MRTSSSAALSILLAGVSAPALAQTEPDGVVAPVGGLSEIIVTAERREQRLQDVPISATVLTGEELIKRGVTNLNDIQQVAPSIAINTFNRSTFINIRGVGIAQSAPTSNPGVAYYIDGQLIPHEQFIGHSFYDIGSIEVLRGPQGTLTGQNSTGGAIYVRTPEPRFNSNFAIGDLTVANYDRFRGVAAVNIGGENVALRVAYIHEQRDSYTVNIAPNAQSQPGNLKMDAVRANLRLEGMDGRLRVNVRGEYFDVRTDNNAVKNRNDLGRPGPIGDPFVISEDGRSFQNQSGYRLSTELGYDISDEIAFRGLVSWQDGSTRDQTDGDRSSTALPVPPNLPTSGTNTRNFPGRVSNAVTVFETLIGEVNLLSTGSGPFQWVVGGFYMDEEVPVSLLRDNRNTTDFFQSNSSIIATAYNTSRSIFGQANWFVTPQVELIAGGRYSWDKQVYTRFALPGPPLPAPFTSDQSSSTFTYKFGVNYHAGEDTLLYATASKGFKAGGVNLDPSLGIFGPENNFVYELGFKSQFMDNRIRVNGAVFYSDYRDIQLASLVQVGPALLPQTQNAAKGKAWGGELEITGKFGGLGFNLGVGYLDAQFAGDDICINNTNAPVGDFPAPTPNPCTAGNSYIPNGAVLPFSPAWTVNAGVQYTFDFGGVAVTPRFQWSHLAEQYATPFPSAITRVPSRDLFDARITFDIGEKYTIEGFVNNLTNKTYIATQIQDSSSATGGIIFGAPRTFGVRLRVQVGD
jgi:iron complex outermembrane recepter protein